MMTTMLDREANSANLIFNAACRMRCHLPEAVPRSILPLLQAGIDALTLFGRSELSHRQADRWEEFGINTGASLDTRRRADRMQELGLQALRAYRDNIPRFIEDLESLIASSSSNPHAFDDLQRAREEITEALAVVEVKRSDAREIFDGLNSCLDVAASLNPGMIRGFLENAVNQLEEVRLQPDRGTIPNLAPWKFWSILGVVGLFLIGAVIAIVMLALTAGLAAPVLAASIAAITGGSSTAMGVISSAIKEFC